MNEIRQGLPVTAESHKVIALTLLKSIGSKAIELCQEGVKRASGLLDNWSRPVDGSEEDSFTTYDSLIHQDHIPANS